MVFWRTLSDIALTLYFFTDHPMFFNAIGLFQYDPKFIKRIDYINNVFWLLNSVFDIIVTVADMHHIQNEIK